MTKTQAVIEHAVANGYDGWGDPGFEKEDWKTLERDRQGILLHLLFNHDFMKALFGKEWRRHAKNMVVRKKPMDYAYKHVKEVA